MPKGSALLLYPPLRHKISIPKLSAYVRALMKLAASPTPPPSKILRGIYSAIKIIGDKC
jgi:hypothetical protein